MSETVFSKIIRREILADVVYEDDLCMAFRDIHPCAPVHVLIVPKDAVPGIQVVGPEHRELLGHLLVVARRVAEQLGIGASGYRCVINVGPDGGQEVPHLHIHLVGGRPMGWPPG
jgi:histidine triad (HIT) family protein